MKEIYNPRSLPSVAVGEEVAPFPRNILLLHASLVWSRVCPAAFPVASCPTRQLRLSNKQVLPSTSQTRMPGTKSDAWVLPPSGF